MWVEIFVKNPNDRSSHTMVGKNIRIRKDMMRAFAVLPHPYVIVSVHPRMGHSRSAVQRNNKPYIFVSGTCKSVREAEDIFARIERAFESSKR